MSRLIKDKDIKILSNTRKYLLLSNIIVFLIWFIFYIIIHTQDELNEIHFPVITGICILFAVIFSLYNILRSGILNLNSKELYWKPILGTSKRIQWTQIKTIQKNGKELIIESDESAIKLYLELYSPEDISFFDHWTKIFKNASSSEDKSINDLEKIKYDNLLIWEKNRKKQFHLSLLFVLYLPLIWMIFGGGFYLLFYDHIQPLGDELFIRFSIIGIIIYIAFSIIIYVKIRQWEIMAFISFINLHFILFIIFIGMFLNAMLDFSKEDNYKCLITSKRISNSKEKMYHVEFQIKEDSDKIKEISIKKNEYYSVIPDKSFLNITIKNGAFGYPWVKRYKIENP